MRLTLQKKLVVGGLVLVLAPILVLGWFAYEMSSEALTQLAQESTVVKARGLANMTDSLVREELKVASGLAMGNTTQTAAQKVAQAGPEGAAAEIAALDRKLTAFRESQGTDYENIMALDRKGRVFSDAAGGKSKGLDLSQRAYFQKAIQGQASVAEVVISKLSGRPVAIIATPIPGARGLATGALVLALELADLNQKITSATTGQTGYATLQTAEGDVIAHPKQEFIMKLNMKKVPGMEKIAAAAMNGQIGVEEYDFKGVHKIAGFAPVPANGWVVMAIQNQDEFLSGVYHLRNGVGLIATVSAALVLLLVILFARSITRPINRVVSGLAQASEQVSAASSQVAASSQQLAQGSSEQAAALEETSAALEELSAMTRQNADNAAQADRLSRQAGQVVEEAAQVTQQLQDSMQSLSQASQETFKIIKSIDEIAFQTNLLALNAAVEAARAGEAGAGFAVVAEEVRSLALRAAEAAKSTSDLIESTVQGIGQGGNLAQQTQTAFGHMAETTEQLTVLIAEIAAASGEQTQGLTSISRAVEEMDQVTQTAASSAEETAAASQEMAGQAASMHGFVGDLERVVQGGGRHREENDFLGGQSLPEAEPWRQPRLLPRRQA
ncbi:MAG: Cache 3/Cache 2 fusion domain-containing protein [Deltaproteobacteria bacterium]|nr:Cache 3/Cache 2 fusion domain-containing protein [Deltaproteobacteria bacterium]